MHSAFTLVNQMLNSNWIKIKTKATEPYLHHQGVPRTAHLPLKMEIIYTILQGVSRTCEPGVTNYIVVLVHANIVGVIYKV